MSLDDSVQGVLKWAWRKGAFLIIIIAIATVLIYKDIATQVTTSLALEQVVITSVIMLSVFGAVLSGLTGHDKKRGLNDDS